MGDFGASKCAFWLPNRLLDRKMSIPEAWDHHFRHSAEHPLFVYEDSPGEIRTITWKTAGHAVHRSVHLVQSYTKHYGQSIQDPSKPPIIGILAATGESTVITLSDAPLIVLLRADHLTYWTVIAGIMRAGYQCFTISPRNSPLAIAHLLETTGCKIAFVSGDNGTQSLMQEALANMERKVAFIDMPNWKELYINDDTNLQTLPPLALHSLDTPCLVVHSSGTIMLQCC